MKKKLIISFLAMMFFVIPILSVPSISFAETAVPEKIDKITTDENYNPDNEVPDVSVDDINKMVSRKGDQVIGLFQTGAVYLSLLMFIVGIVLTLVGLIGQHGAATKGFIVMFVSAFMYTVSQYSTEVVIFFKNFLIS